MIDLGNLLPAGALLLCAGLSPLRAAPPASSAIGVEEPGWLCRAQVAAQPGGVQLLPSPDFALRAGESLSPFFDADAALEFVTEIELPRAAQVQFGLELEGVTAQLRLLDPDGAPCSQLSAGAGSAGIVFGDSVTSVGGLYSLRLLVNRDARGDARLALYWRGQTRNGQHFLAEPVPLRITRLPLREAGAAQLARELQLGLDRIEDSGCTACHTASTSPLGRRMAPELGGVGPRLGAQWMQRWLLDPSGLKPGTTMPSLLRAGAAGAEQARDLVAFLQERTGLVTDSAVAGEASVIDAGFELYHSVGCVACHGALADFPDEGEEAESLEDEPLEDEQGAPERGAPAGPPLPFGELGGKWSLDGLRSLLADPGSCYPDGRMPALLANEAEVDAVANYLAREFGTPAAASAPDPARVARGREAYRTLGCASCHTLRELAPASPAPSLKRAALAGGGCVSAAGARSGAGEPVRYRFDGATRRALEATLARLAQDGLAPAPLEASRRALRAANCRACHQRDGSGGPSAQVEFLFETFGDVDMGDEGRLPPHIDGVGFKLGTSWLREVLADGARARPYMKTRMPRFGARIVDGLAEGLARLDGLWPDSDPAGPEVTDERVRNGRELMGPRGLACMACHVYAGQLPSGLPGPDITAFGARLRYDWWRSYVHDPARFKPGTRMPSFSDGVRSSIEGILDGDARAQADALWSYFSLGELMPPPEGVGAPSGTVLVVGARPLVLRAFLPEAGSRGIAVGFPSGLHFAFDAAAVRLVDSWRGDFLNVSGAWSGRGGNEVGGQGAQVWKALAGMPLRVGEPVAEGDGSPSTGRAAGWQFRGYRLDAEGSPQFLYDGPEGLSVREQLLPLPRPGVLFERRLSLSNLRAGMRLSVRTAAREVPRVIGQAEVGPLERIAGGLSETHIRVDGETLEISIEVAN